jgi:hypothetical protein
MNEQNRHRLERLTARYADRLKGRTPPAEEEFLRAFADVRERVLRPPLEEIAAELRRAGHAARVVISDDALTPGIELELGLVGATGSHNAVGFAVIRWANYPLQILAYLEVNPPRFDLARFGRPEELRPDQVEQVVVDAVEHVITCNAP